METQNMVFFVLRAVVSCNLDGSCVHGYGVE